MSVKHLATLAPLHGRTVIAIIIICCFSGLFTLLLRPLVDDLASRTCGIRVNYTPSPWEAEWAENIDTWRSDTRAWAAGCKQMRDRKEHVDHWLGYWKQREQLAQASDMPPLSAQARDWSPEVFSRHVYTDSCTGQVLFELPIEPLVGFLRHPQTHCGGGGNVDKDYMLPLFRNEWNSTNPYSGGQSTSFIFDLGASVYNSGLGGASQSWFIDTYLARGYRFQRILDWEAKEHPPKVLFEGIPLDIMTGLSYFNIPVTSEPNDKYNPLTYIRTLCKPEDFVVLKIDIDTPNLEEALIKQVVNDPQLAVLIDELYFEHHVSGSPMQHRGWGNIPGVHLGGDIVDSYKLFTKLRELGIRAHSWV